MWSVSKGRFVQLGGLSISNRILPGWLRAQGPAGRGAANKVIVVTFGGGVRYSETFAPEGLHNIPRLTAMRPQGNFFKSCINSGVLSHFNSTASILTGNWQRVDDFGFQPPAGPTLFEKFRKQSGAGPTDAWAVATNKSFASMGCSSDAAFGQPYGANVVLPKQLLLEAGEDGGEKGAARRVAGREDGMGRVEGGLGGGCGGAGS